MSSQADSGCWQSPAVQTHLNNLQRIIVQMSVNCAWCKKCSIIASTIIFIGYRASSSYYSANISIISLPLIFFCMLDAYYLSFEREFKTIYNSFIQNLAKDNQLNHQIFYIPVQEGFIFRLISISKSILAPSVFLFYLVLAILSFWLIHSG